MHATRNHDLTEYLKCEKEEGEGKRVVTFTRARYYRLMLVLDKIFIVELACNSRKWWIKKLIHSWICKGYFLFILEIIYLIYRFVSTFIFNIPCTDIFFYWESSWYWVWILLKRKRNLFEVLRVRISFNGVFFFEWKINSIIFLRAMLTRRKYE